MGRAALLFQTTPLKHQRRAIGRAQEDDCCCWTSSVLASSTAAAMAICSRSMLCSRLANCLRRTCTQAGDIRSNAAYCRQWTGGRTVKSVLLCRKLHVPQGRHPDVSSPSGWQPPPHGPWHPLPLLHGGPTGASLPPFLPALMHAAYLTIGMESTEGVCILLKPWYCLRDCHIKARTEPTSYSSSWCLIICACCKACLASSISVCAATTLDWIAARFSL